MSSEFLWNMLNMKDWGDIQLEILTGWKFYLFNIYLSNPGDVFKKKKLLKLRVV